MTYREYSSKMIEHPSGKYAICVDSENKACGWVFYKHVDGQWVTLRLALPGEIEGALKRYAQIKIELDIPEKG